MEDSVKGIKSQILYDWRNSFETRAQFELFISQIDMLIESVERECKLTQRALDGANVCRVIEHVYVDGTCAQCGSPEPPRK